MYISGWMLILFLVIVFTLCRYTYSHYKNASIRLSELCHRKNIAIEELSNDNMERKHNNEELEGEIEELKKEIEELRWNADYRYKSFCETELKNLKCKVYNLFVSMEESECDVSEDKLLAQIGYTLFKYRECITTRDEYRAECNMLEEKIYDLELEVEQLKNKCKDNEKYKIPPFIRRIGKHRDLNNEK